MALFKQKTKATPKPPFDPETEEAAIRCSICTGEQVAGFRNKTTGHFREVTLLRDAKDLDNFKKDYGVSDCKKIF
ncbi:MAG: aspartate dehydrogenase [Oscillospiraceae bacterium]|nr:aspartate dehydrogenase [Oscillospiraceae bacterium]